jgi:hypothetical protein
MFTALPNKKVHKKRAVGKEGVRTPQSRTTMSSGSNKYSDTELETFSKFDAFVCRDGYDPERHVVPTGYAEFAVEHQFDATHQPCRRELWCEAFSLTDVTQLC